MLFVLCGCDASSIADAGSRDATADVQSVRDASAGDTSALDGIPGDAIESDLATASDVSAQDTVVPGADVTDASRPLDRFESLFARRFVPHATPWPAATDPSGVSYHCLAAASGLRRANAGASFDATFRAQLDLATRAAADHLLAIAPTWGGSGWGLDRAWDAFSDGTTNAANTVYAFQTGLATWCLAEAADVTGDTRYRTLAARAITNYRTRAFVRHGEGYPINCTTCGYFWYSLAAADVGRMVKNTNIEMAVASLVLDRYGADSAARLSGAQATLAQYGEIFSYANYGYLGRYDTAYVPMGSSWYDDHNSFEAYLLLRASELLGRTDFRAAAITHYDAYAPRGSAAYVAYAACHFARVHAPAAATCAGWIEANGANNPAGVGLVMDYR